MSIRYRILILIGLALILLTAVDSLTSQYIMARAFSRVETDSLQRNVHRVQTGLEAMREKLGLITEDWSNRDDPYAFVQGERPDFITQHLSAHDVHAMDVQLAILVDLQGTVFWSGMAIDSASPFTPIPEEQLDAILSFFNLKTPESTDGYMMIHQDMMLLSARPILPPDRRGPAAGTLIFGQQLTVNFQDRLASLLQYPITIYLQADPLNLNTNRHPHRPHPQLGDRVHLLPEMAFVHAPLTAPDGTEIALLCVSISRDIFAEMHRTRRLMTFSIAVIALLLGGSAMVYLEKTVLQPLGAVLDTVIKWKPDDPDNAPVALTGKGEVRALGKALNDIRDAAQEAHAQRAAKQEALILQQRMEAMGLLAGGLAHDFNNLLTAQRYSLTLASKPGNSPEKIHQYLKLLDQSITRASGLINQLSTFASGGVMIRTSVDLAFLAEQTAELVCREKKYSCRYEWEAALPPAWADEGRIAQVLLNLFLNATEAMPNGGLITVRGRKVDQESKDGAKASFVQIEINDQGPGIDPSITAKLFEPYFTTKARSGGLGLPSCQTILRRQGGRIEVESQPGEGATFRMLLPVAPPAAA
jgi:signal transduction histidine kinase